MNKLFLKKKTHTQKTQEVEKSTNYQASFLYILLIADSLLIAGEYL
jgi:hypothetical protein